MNLSILHFNYIEIYKLSDEILNIKRLSSDYLEFDVVCSLLSPKTTETRYIYIYIHALISR